MGLLYLSEALGLELQPAVHPQAVAELLDDKNLERQLARLDAGSAQWADRLTELIDTELPARIRVRDELVQDLTQHIDGKLCLVGQVKTGLVDLHNTPIGRLPGIIVNAAALNTLLLDNPLRIEPLSITLLVTIGLMLGAAVLFFQLDVVPATVSVVPLLLVVGWMHHGLLAWQNIITQPVLPLVGIVAASRPPSRWRSTRDRTAAARAVQAGCLVSIGARR